MAGEREEAKANAMEGSRRWMGGPVRAPGDKGRSGGSGEQSPSEQSEGERK